MPIRSVDVSTGVTSVRAATASAMTSKQSQRPPASPTEASKVTTTTAVAVPATQAAPPPPKPTSESQMRFHVDQDTGKTVVALVDPDNGEVLRQFPTAEALEVAKEIGR